MGHILGLKNSRHWCENEAACERDHEMHRYPYTSIKNLVAKTGLSTVTVTKALKHLEIEIVKETTGGQRNRFYAYHECLSLINQGTELP